MVNCLIFVNHKKSNVTLNHIIETGTHQPIYTPPYRRSPKDHQTITDETGKFSQQIIIEPSTSPWCSPVVLVRQKDGSTRFCVNYRKLNDISVKDSFPLPRIEDIFDQLSQPNYFTTLDFKNGYFQIPLTPHDLTKTAFSTRDNHYQFTVFPQGNKNGPPTRRRYLFEKFDDRVLHSDEILQLLHTYNFRLSVEKCTIATDTINYLGNNICRGGLRPNNDNVRGLLETTTPNTPKEIFRFLKAAQYYHEQAAVEQLKYNLPIDFVLRLPNNQLPFKIQTDASQFGIGAVLLQTYPEDDRPKSQINGKCERWRLKLQSYNFTIKHIKGTSNTMPDYLSRSPVDHAEDEIDDEVRSTSVTTTIANDTSDKNSLPVSSAVGMVTTRSRARLLSLLISKILLHQTITILISSLTQLTHPRPT
ncbi:unnamed protein product [Rotaria socialis]|uniref:Reverse transcriptase/retrotransposon-derived protein RNase H-like domain-containing protein n=1 Tax=Rotaria socialis TaxID=392032 RepID=A0A820VL10_9BILA|nr:unnamed protein product [Rotaria socialis]CAF3473651.1 unnamed protein product [Rotaria socialis]CAF4503319.1 unnamed protein product [Rotaria socialis]